MGEHERVGAALREQLRARGWTAADLGRTLDVHRGTVNRMTRCLRSQRVIRPPYPPRFAHLGDRPPSTWMNTD